MDRMDCLTKELSEAIKSSEVTRRYLAAKEKIKNAESLMIRLKEFRTMQLDYQIKQLQNIEMSFDEEKYMSSLYSNLILNDDIRLFLESEKDLLNLMTNIQNTISESCPIDFDWLNNTFV